MANEKFIYKNIISLEETDSTNNIAKKLAIDGAKEGTIVTSLCQTGGKGRQGRTWLSNKGEGLYMSIVLRPEFSPILANKITHLAGMGIAKAISKLINLDVFVKWPNDVILNEKKIAGILTEVSTTGNKTNFIILGIGVNLNQKIFPKELENKATSLFLETKKEFSIENVMDNVLKEIECYYFDYKKNLDFSLFVNEYKKYLINLNREIILVENGAETRVFATDINQDGELIILTKDGKEIIVRSGEISLKGIDGYI